MTDRNRPWPHPLFKGVVRVVYAGLLIWDFWPPTYWIVYIGAFFTLAIWIFLEWTWLQSYRQWLEQRAARDFFERLDAGAITTACPECGEEGIVMQELEHHLRLFHPDLEMAGLRPHIILDVHKPPLWTRLW